MSESQSETEKRTGTHRNKETGKQRQRDQWCYFQIYESFFFPSKKQICKVFMSTSYDPLNVMIDIASVIFIAPNSEGQFNSIATATKKQ